MANFADKAGGKNSVGTFGAYVPRIFTNNDRDPSIYDWQGYNILDQWWNKITLDTFILVSLQGTSSSKGSQAKWVKFADTTGLIVSLTGSHGIVIGGTPTIPDVSIANTITLGDLANVTGGNALTLTTGDITVTNGRLFLTDCTNPPFSVALGGGVFFGSNQFMHNYPGAGLQNTFLGILAGNNTLNTGTAGTNTCIGYVSGSSLTTGASNTFLGSGSGNQISSGIQNLSAGSSSLGSATSAGANTCLGYSSANSLLTGTNNIALGQSSGGSWVGAESNNIAIYNTGVAAESGNIRIGTNGTHVKNFQQGITGVTPGVINPLAVVIDSAGQLGTIPTAISSSFSAYLSADVLNFTGNGAAPTVIFDTEVFDTNNDYNNATNVFTAPVNGVYQFNVTVSISNLSGAMTSGLGTFRVVGTSASVGTWGITRANPTVVQDVTTGIWRYNGGLSTVLNAGDTVFCGVQVSNGAGNTATLSTGGAPLGGTWFSGCRIG